MSKRVSREEEALYEPVLKALEIVFSTLGECHLEITARKCFSDKLQKVFDDVALYMTKVEEFYPDITGFVKTDAYSINFITVEVKLGSPKIKDIFQAKNYAQIFKAKYALLISTESISEPKRRLILKRNEIISRYPYESVVLARFDKDMECLHEKFEVDKELYYSDYPEPFKTYKKAFEAENLIISERKFKPIVVHVTNAGEVPVKIVKVKVDSLLSHIDINIILNPKEEKWINLEEYVLWGMITEPRKIELTTELGKIFSHIK